MLTCLASRVEAADFFTTNSDSLVHFWAAAESSNRPVTVVSFGDSMANSWLSPNFRFMNKLTERLGIAGFSLNNYRNALMFQLTNGASYADPDAIWFCRYQVLPPEGGIWWMNELNAGGIYSDKLGIYFVRHPAGGQFTLSVSTNGAPWFPMLTLDGYAISPAGYYTNLILPPDYYRLRVDGVTGTNYIIGVQLLMSHANGVHAAFLDHWGISLEHVTSVPAAIREPIFAGLSPDLLVWHMKEDANLTFSNQMVECERWWSNAAPGCDVIYSGTPWTANDSTQSVTLDQNTIVRNIAVNHRRAYIDLMQPFVSYQWMRDHWFMLDDVHLNYSGTIRCANIMWDDLGLFALGQDRSLSVEAINNQVRLTYNTSTGAVYRLETSTNLQNWIPLLTNPPGNAVFSTNFAPDGQACFRLGLSPN